MGLTVTKAELVKLVKFCILDSAVINGNPIQDCIGTVTKDITYNGKSTTIETTINEADITRYFSEKSYSRRALSH